MWRERFALWQQTRRTIRCAPVLGKDFFHLFPLIGPEGRAMISSVLTWCYAREGTLAFTRWQRESLFLVDDVLAFLDEELSLLIVFHHQAVANSKDWQRSFSFCSAAAFLALAACVGVPWLDRGVKIEGRGEDGPVVIPDSQEEEGMI
jgi:hypothetical protein